MGACSQFASDEVTTERSEGVFLYRTGSVQTQNKGFSRDTPWHVPTHRNSFDFRGRNRKTATAFKRAVSSVG